jgi:hypothetical protein
MFKSRVRIFLDDNPDPIIDEHLPADIKLDTRNLTDGNHRLTIRAQDNGGQEGVEEIPFRVHNGPGIVVSGLAPHSTRRGVVRFGVDAFSNDDPFDPRRAEARASIPVWVFVLALFVVAWAVWYAASMWKVPEAYRNTPTYSSRTIQPQTPDVARRHEPATDPKPSQNASGH